MRITYLGHSAFLLEDGGKSVVVDPFLTGNPRAARTADELDPADDPPDPRPQRPRRRHGRDRQADRRDGDRHLRAGDLPRPSRASRPSRATTAGRSPSTAARPSSSRPGTPRRTPTTFVAPGIPAGLVVRFGGKTVYFAGDTCLFGDMALIGEEGLDVAVLPIGDLFTMGPADAAKAARLLRARLRHPLPLQHLPADQAGPQAFQALVEEQHREPLPCRWRPASRTTSDAGSDDDGALQRGDRTDGLPAQGRQPPAAGGGAANGRSRSSPSAATAPAGPAAPARSS